MRAAHLITYLTSHEVFSDLDEPALNALAGELEHVHLGEGETLFRQGDPGDSMYVLIQGRLGMRLQDAVGRDMVIGEEAEPGTTIGEMSLVTGQPRVVTVYAPCGAELVRLSKRGFDRLTEGHPQVVSDLAEVTALRWRRVQLARVLAELLGEIDAEALLDLQTELEWLQLSHGEVLFHEGDPGDAAYIVVNGRLRIATMLPDGSEWAVDESGPGEMVGEFALLTGEPRSATVYAIRETNVVRLAAPVFSRLLAQYPQAMMHIARTIIGYHRRSLRPATARRTTATNLALMPASPGVQLADFAHDLAGSLEAFGPVLHLGSARFDELFGRAGAAQTPLDDPTNPVLASWLSGQETRCQYILYEADPIWSPWTQRCACQADRLLIVGQSDGDPEPGAMEAAIQSFGVAARTELVLLHPATTIRPRSTSEWLASRTVAAHHHVRAGDRAHHGSLARRLADRAIALVLSGGAARGFAHLGVFRALEELGIRVDRMGGTSMGALLAAGYAMGRTHAEMVDLAQSFANPEQLFDYTLPLTSLMASKKLTRVMKELFAGLCIEDLWCPYFCVSSNLTRAEPVVHQSGELWRSVRSSIAMPGVFAPILHEGDVLVDGGALNNFPVDIMRDLCKGGTVIGVNVSQTHESSEEYEFGDSISGWKVLWSRLNPFAEQMRVPTIAASLVRALEIKGVHQIRTTESFADLLIQPDVGHFKTLDFASYEAVSEIGYQAALEQLRPWKEQHDLVGAPIGVNYES